MLKLTAPLFNKRQVLKITRFTFRRKEHKTTLSPFVLCVKLAWYYHCNAWYYHGNACSWAQKGVFQNDEEESQQSWSVCGSSGRAKCEPRQGHSLLIYRLVIYITSPPFCSTRVLPMFLFPVLRMSPLYQHLHQGLLVEVVGVRNLTNHLSNQ